MILMEKLKIIQPTIDEWSKINELAKQVHKLHINWNSDLFLDVEEVISMERLNKLLETDSIYVAKVNGEIVGYIIIDIKEKDNGFMRYRKLLSIDTLCIDEDFRGQGIYSRTFGKMGDNKVIQRHGKGHEKTGDNSRQDIGKHHFKKGVHRTGTQILGGLKGAFVGLF